MSDIVNMQQQINELQLFIEKLKKIINLCPKCNNTILQYKNNDSNTPMFCPAPPIDHPKTLKFRYKQKKFLYCEECDTIPYINNIGKGVCIECKDRLWRKGNDDLYYCKNCYIEPPIKNNYDYDSDEY